MMHADSNAADDVGRSDSSMNAHRDVCIVETVGLARMSLDQRGGLSELLSLEKSTGTSRVGALSVSYLVSPSRCDHS
jgi:hypothetical protein